MVWPLAIYFAWHSLHQRAEGNWTAPIFPAFAIAAAAAAHGIAGSGRWRSLADWSSKLAVPIGLAIAAGIEIQAIFGLIPLGALDPTVRVLGAGWRELGPQIDSLRTETGPPAVLTSDHGLAGWLSFYLPSRPLVVQVGERFRWVNEPPLSPQIFKGSLIFVCPTSEWEATFITRRYNKVEKIAAVVRERGGVVIKRHSVFRVSGLTGDPLNNATLREVLARRAHDRQTLDQPEGQGVADVCEGDIPVPTVQVQADLVFRGR